MTALEFMSMMVSLEEVLLFADLVIVITDTVMWRMRMLKHERQNNKQGLFSVNRYAFAVTNVLLTFAGLHALRPSVTHVVIASASTMLIPRTTRSTATHLT